LEEAAAVLQPLHRGRNAFGVVSGSKTARALLLLKGWQASTDLSARGWAMNSKQAKFTIGQVVRHRVFPFRGVIFDVDPIFSNSEEWYQAIPEEVRPNKDQPFYHLLAENAESYYVAYVSEQNLLEDATGEPIGHPQVGELFGELRDGQYEPISHLRH
jgi:heat shock protein HspQ